MKLTPKFIFTAGFTLWFLFALGVVALDNGVLGGKASHPSLPPAPPGHKHYWPPSAAMAQTAQLATATTDTTQTSSTLNATTSTLSTAPPKKKRPAAYGPEIPPPPVRRPGMLQDSQSCAECHLEVTPYFEGDAHKADDFYCITCHGPSKIHNVQEELGALTDNAWRRWGENGWEWHKEKATLEIALFCCSCHDFRPAKELKVTPIPWEGYILTRHGQAVLRGSMDAPTCTDCHSGHGVYAMTWEMDEITETCAICHTDVERMMRAGISPSVIEDFKMGVHGGLSTPPDQHLITCTDCHPPHI